MHNEISRFRNISNTEMVILIVGVQKYGMNINTSKRKMYEIHFVNQPFRLVPTLLSVITRATCGMKRNG